MDKDIQRVIIDAADALLLGIPSSILLQDIRKTYAIDYADALQLVEKLQQAINQEGITMEQYTEDKNRILSQINGYSPLGAFRAQLLDKYNEADKAYQSSFKRSTDLTQQMVEAQNDASRAAMNMSKSLGTEAKERNVML